MLLIPGPDGSLNGIYTGDAFNFMADIEPESVDLILCDPVYWDIEQYSKLAYWGNRLLKVGGNLIAQTGYQYRFEAESAMHSSRGNLIHRPLLCEIFSGGNYQDFHNRMVVGLSEYIWFTKGKEITRESWIRNVVQGGGKDKSHHEWGDSSYASKFYISRLTSPGDLVVDPFSGGGTVPVACKETGRRWLAFDLDSKNTESIRQRLLITQPVLEDLYKQLEF